jgi:hypothetical protein
MVNTLHSRGLDKIFYYDEVWFHLSGEYKVLKIRIPSVKERHTP